MKKAKKERKKNVALFTGLTVSFSSQQIPQTPFDHQNLEEVGVSLFTEVVPAISTYWLVLHRSKVPHLSDIATVTPPRSGTPANITENATIPTVTLPPSVENRTHCSDSEVLSIDWE